MVWSMDHVFSIGYIIFLYCYSFPTSYLYIHGFIHTEAKTTFLGSTLSRVAKEHAPQGIFKWGGVGRNICKRGRHARPMHLHTSLRCILFPTGDESQPDVPFRENFARVCFEALLQFSFIHKKETSLGKVLFSMVYLQAYCCSAVQ